MANSLMELYGGGMLGPSNNYQLGGAVQPPTAPSMPQYKKGGKVK